MIFIINIKHLYADITTKQKNRLGQHGHVHLLYTGITKGKSGRVGLPRLKGSGLLPREAALKEERTVLLKLYEQIR